MASSGGYYDKWKRGGGSPRFDPSGEMMRLYDDRINACQDNVDQLASRVSVCEDRTEASAKLAQLTQNLTEQKFDELGGGIHELRQRNKRHDELLKKLIMDVDDIAQSRHDDDLESAFTLKWQRSNEAVASLQDSTRRYFSQHDALAGEVADIRSDFDRRMADFQSEVRSELQQLAMQLTRGMTEVHQDVASLREQVREEARAIRTHCEARIDQHKAPQTSPDAEAFRSNVVANVNALQQHCRTIDEQFAEHRNQLRNVTHRCDERFSEVESKVAHGDHRLQSLRNEFGEHVSAYREHLQQQTQRSQETAGVIQQLIEMTETGRVAVSSEINSVKDWALRNMQRLRKRAEQALHDVRLLKEEHAVLAVQVERTTSVSDKQHQVMTELLTQQTEKANILSRMVDKEIETRRNRTPSPHRRGLSSERTTSRWDRDRDRDREQRDEELADRLRSTRLTSPPRPSRARSATIDVPIRTKTHTTTVRSTLMPDYLEK
eukprot:Sspe_Gene.13540::Locus_4633_Transcript_1_2_Confidence_0.286_Length_1636::g.13540::m.13540